MTQPNSPFQDDTPQRSPEDVALVSFLRSNAPVSPEAPSKLEADVMLAIYQEGNPPGLKTLWFQNWSWTRWRTVAMISFGVAVVGIAVGQLQHWLSPSGLSTAQLVQLESFMVSSWGDLVEPNEPLADWDLLSAPPPRSGVIAPTHSSLTVDSGP